MMRAAGEVRVLWGRNMVKTVRVPILLFFSLFQPLIFLLLFSQVFAELDRLPGFPYDDYLQFLIPSIIALTALNSAFQSGMGTVTDMEDGLLDKFLISPIHRYSILAGRVLSDGSRIVLQALVIVAVAYAMGTRFETGVAGLVVIVVLAALFGMAWAGLSNIVALLTGNAELTMVIGILVTFPVLFLSTAFMPAVLLPAWLDVVSAWNPITYIVEALRALVNDGWDWGAIWETLAVTALLAVVTLTGATAAFRRAIR